MVPLEFLGERDNAAWRILAKPLFTAADHALGFGWRVTARANLLRFALEGPLQAVL
jgi:hypothetical protein